VVEPAAGRGWRRFCVSVEVAALTGYTFFDKLPKNVIGPLKEKAVD
jgi:hypothetical protein